MERSFYRESRKLMLMDSAQTICITIDVEWACQEVVAEIVRLLNERGLRATFFCTHADIDVPGHERAIHPNFRRNGDTLRQLYRNLDGALEDLTDEMVYRHVVHGTKAFCPEAIGVRAHSLFYESYLLPIYRQAGLQYDSSYFLPLDSGLRPVWKEFDMLEIPVYYIDHWDLITQASDFRLEGLRLDHPGMKVFDFHPNLVFMNASTTAQYLASKPHYHNAERLLSLRQPGRGALTLFLELLDFIATKRFPSFTLAQANAESRTARNATDVSRSDASVRTR
jgi:peptidoglycan/xylan/chitin deacetylase (PgdA/CDA1 family)